MEDIKNEAYVEVDKNLFIETSIDEPDIRFYDTRKKPFRLYGFYDPIGQPFFRRLPEDVAAKTSAGVAKLCRESTGGRVRFGTDSKYIAIRAELGPYARHSHFTLCNSAGFDLYEDTSTDSRFIKPFLPPYDFDHDYEQIIRLKTRKQRQFTINFPVHAVVRNLYIGLQNDAVLTEGKKYSDNAPVIFYGSSIVHGTAASRPGLTYENIISRRLNTDFINLGFSGKAKGEEVLAEYMAGMEASVFVCDYDHNAPNAEHLRNTHRRLYDIYRSKKPDTPYIMISLPDVSTRMADDNQERKDVIIDTYRYARAKGDKNVYYIDGETFFEGKYENECSMDGAHPNDLGFTLMADGIEDKLRHIIAKRAGT